MTERRFPFASYEYETVAVCPEKDWVSESNLPSESYAKSSATFPAMPPDNVADERFPSGS